MRRLLFVVLCLLAACEPAPPAPSCSTAGACSRSFRPTLQAWERRHGRVPDGCEYLDDIYAVQIVSAADMPCEMEPGSIITGCTVKDDAIYLLEGRLPAQLVDTSVHEWVHVLAECVDGDIDADHLRARLWARYGTDTVEFQAQAAARIGECL